MSNARTPESDGYEGSAPHVRITEHDGTLWPDRWPEPHVIRPSRPLTEYEFQAILSVLSGQTKEEWIAQRQAEGKPISPVEDEKQE